MARETTTKLRIIEAYPLIAAILVGALLRLYQFGRTPLWDDEAITYFASSQGLTHLFGWLPQDPHPPLHYLLEAATIRWIGSSEALLRLPSLLTGIALIVTTGLIGTRLAGRSGGFWSALLVATSPVLIWQSHNARCYSILALTMLLCAWALWRYTEAPSWRWGAIAAGCGLVSVYLHYLGLLLLPLGIAIIALQRSARRASSWAPLAVIVAGAVPLGFLIAQQLKWMRATGTESVSVFAAMKRAVHVLGPGPELDGPSKMPLCLVFVMACGAITVALLRDPTARRNAALPASAAAIYFTLMFGFVSLNLWAIVDYHYAIVIPLLALLAGAGLSALPSGAIRNRVAAWVLVGPTVGTLLAVLRPPNPISDFATARRLISASPAEAVILPRLTDLYCYAYYTPNRVPMAVLSRHVTPDPIVGIHLKPVDELIPQAQSVWLLSKGSENGGSGFRRMHQRLAAHGYRRTRGHRSPGLLAVRWERDAHAVIPK